MRAVGLLGTRNASPEGRHDDEPAVGQLIISYYRIPIVQFFTRSTKSFENATRVSPFRSEKQWPVPVVSYFFPFLV